MSRTIDIIHHEHRALAAVLQTFKHLADGIAAGRMEPDFKLLASMIEYIAEMPEKLHHPKEENLLHKALRPKVPEVRAVLDRLVDEHRQSPQATLLLARALVKFEALGMIGAKEFRQAVDGYVRSNLEHMSLEEREIMPLAKRVLSAEEWRAIDAEFEANADPWKGRAGEFEDLFKRILAMTPAPYGLGDS